jgi:hypothetical protein
VALLLADFARREHRQAEMRPQRRPPGNDKSAAHRTAHSPTKARKRSPQG